MIILAYTYAAFCAVLFALYFHRMMTLHFGIHEITFVAQNIVSGIVCGYSAYLIADTGAMHPLAVISPVMAGLYLLRSRDTYLRRGQAHRPGPARRAAEPSIQERTMITAEQLALCVGAPLARVMEWLDPLSAAMDVFAITTPARQAAFLANVGHESAGLYYRREIWGPNAAQLGYEGRKDLGNYRPGDGKRYMGRGPLQVTGHANYIATRDKLREYVPNVPDFEQSPELLELPRWGSYAAGLFWHTNEINVYADAGDFDGVCDVINRGHKTEREGDSNGYTMRLALWISAKRTLGVEP